VRLDPRPLKLIIFCTAAPAGIDAEVAQFFATQAHEGPVAIDEETNARLRMKVHKRVLVVMVVTYCECAPCLRLCKLSLRRAVAQTLDKGCVNSRTSGLEYLRFASAP
jgi:hypothetical protein